MCRDRDTHVPPSLSSRPGTFFPAAQTWCGVEVGAVQGAVGRRSCQSNVGDVPPPVDTSGTAPQSWPPEPASLQSGEHGQVESTAQARGPLSEASRP